MPAVLAGERAHLAAWSAGEPLVEIVNAMLESPAGQREWPLPSYSPDLLFTVAARGGISRPISRRLPFNCRPQSRKRQSMTETDQYRERGYVALAGLFPPLLLSAFYEQMRLDLGLSNATMSRFAARGPLLTKDAIEIYALQYPPMLTFLWGLTPRIALATGCELLPTYAYFRLYQRGDVCRVHTDRPACEHSLSLTIAYGSETAWALSVATAPDPAPQPIVRTDFEGGAFGSVAMQPGDGVLYQGVHHRHGRLDPNPNAWSAHLFLHWVDANGRYRDQAFDRPTIERANAKS